MKKFDFLIVGGGLTGGYAIKTLVENKTKGSIALISTDSRLPYDRPSLSKSFLLGKQTEKQLYINPPAFYKDNKIKTFLNTKVIGLDSRSKKVVTDKGQEISFEKLLLATGVSVRKLNIPGSELKNILYLRTLSDSKVIKDAAKTAKSAVVIGSSFIGMELASAFAQKGIRTTILDSGNKVFPKLASREISAFLEKYYKERGVEIIHYSKATRFDGENHVESVTQDSGQNIKTDLVAVGIGVDLNLDYLNQKLEINNGVIVNEKLETSAKDIWAGGDIANYYDPIFQKQRRVEHWDIATRHGEIAARNMLGHNQKYSGVSYYFSDIFDLSFDLVGDNTDFDETILRGSPKEKSFMLFYIKNDQLKAFFALGVSQEEKEAAEKLIVEKSNLKSAKVKIKNTSKPISFL